MNNLPYLNNNKQASFLRSKQDLPCLNCQYIEMGEMACYQETCPDCGRVPPVRQKEIRKYKECLQVAHGEVRTFRLSVAILGIYLIWCIVQWSSHSHHATH